MYADQRGTSFQIWWRQYSQLTCAQVWEDAIEFALGRDQGNPGTLDDLASMACAYFAAKWYELALSAPIDFAVLTRAHRHIQAIRARRRGCFDSVLGKQGPRPSIWLISSNFIQASLGRGDCEDLANSALSMLLCLDPSTLQPGSMAHKVALRVKNDWRDIRMMCGYVLLPEGVTGHAWLCATIDGKLTLIETTEAMVHSHPLSILLHLPRHPFNSTG